MAESHISDPGTRQPFTNPQAPGSWDRHEARDTAPRCEPSGEHGSGTAEQIKNKATEILETAKDVGSEMKTKVQEAAHVAGDKADATRRAAGQQMHSLAEKIREGGDVVSDKADQLGTYLQEHDFSAMGRDLTQVVRRYPIQALLVGIG